ncbi:MAG: response regulator [Gemmatimonadetes bacterium]|nr:response regulator [Gemmatimonadota bacterium]
MTEQPLHGDLSQPLVLIGNDQEWSSRSLESLLIPAGFRTARAYTGSQVLQLATSLMPDAVLIDRSLPDMSGAEVVELLRQLPGFDPATPIVLLTTGTTSRAQRLEAHRAGAWDLLAEPWDVEALLLKLHLYVRARRSSPPLRQVG